MRGRSSRGGGLLRNQRGGMVPMMAAGLLAFLGVSGLVMDGGRAYLGRARLARAVDAAALAGARGLRGGESAARAQALAVAAANGLRNGAGGAALSVTFGTNQYGERTVGLVATQPVKTIFAGLFGQKEFTLRSGATAALTPIDMVLVLDQSTSLDKAHAFDDLQTAAKSFVNQFDDRADQVGLVSFHTRAVERHKIQHNFKVRLTQSIDKLTSINSTNIGEGLRLAFDQMQANQVRDRSVKAVVLFTDGQPTAFRGRVRSNPSSLRDAILSASRNGRPPNLIEYLHGIFLKPDDLPRDSNMTPADCAGEDHCHGWDISEILDQAALNARTQADRLRAEGVHIYAIGLGDPKNVTWPPDPDFLRELANVDGKTNSKQPKGKMYFAPSAAELQSVFDQVARDLQVRLAQ